MKVKILFLALVVTLTSCEKKLKDIQIFDKKEKPCAVVNTENLPREVSSTFNQKYSGASHIAWFDKDEKAYVAVFTLNGKETKAKFEKNGAFVKEELENNDDDDDNGCSCDTEGDDKD